MKAYKFVTADVADVVAAGSVRLTPAEDLRRTTDKVGARGDQNELKSCAKIKGGEENVRSDHPAFGPNQFVAIIGGNRVPFEMTVVGESTAIIEDALLYCASLEDTSEIRRRMREDFGAGAVFEIADVHEFARILSRHPDLSLRELTKGKVQYRDLTMSDSIADLSPVDPLLKDSKFSWQREFRLIWGADFLQRRIDLNVLELSRLLKRLPWELPPTNEVGERSS
jgi:hypothetical protein